MDLLRAKDQLAADIALASDRGSASSRRSSRAAWLAAVEEGDALSARLEKAVAALAISTSAPDL
jgi:hypothetical protein